jgi:hypothetical protein
MRYTIAGVDMSARKRGRLIGLILMLAVVLGAVGGTAVAANADEISAVLYIVDWE